MSTETTQLVSQITAALEYIDGDEDKLRAYTTWQLENFMDVVCLSHMTTAEQMAIAAVLAPVFARVLSGTPPKPKRRLSVAS